MFSQIYQALETLLKTVAFIAGKSENQAAEKNFIRFSIDI